jgi:hypothetical protein
MSNIPRIYSSQAAQIRGMPTGGGGGGKAVPGDAAASIQRAASAVPAKAEKQHLGYHWRHFIAGGMGGMVGATMTCPLEVVKTVLQSKEQKNKSVVRVVGGILRYEGLPGFFKGIGPMVLGVVPARATYFATYDGTKVHSPPHTPFLLLLFLAHPLFLSLIRRSLSCAVKTWPGSFIAANCPRRKQHPHCGGPPLHPQPRTGRIVTGDTACSPPSACARHALLLPPPPLAVHGPPWPSLASNYLILSPNPFLFSALPSLSALSIRWSLD